MNENFKSSKLAQNDLESVCIGPGSVPAKFQLSRVSWRGIMGLIHCPNFVPRLRVSEIFVSVWGQ